MKLKLGNKALTTEFNFDLFNNGLLSQPNVLGHFNKIGISLSGGLDSLALLCLILTELELADKLSSIPVTCYCVTKNDGCTYYSVRLLQQVEQRFNCKLSLVNNIYNPHANAKPSYFNTNILKNIVGAVPNLLLFSGDNLPPPPTIVKFNNTSGVKADPFFIAYNNLVSPFYHMHKPQILDIIYQIGCEDLIQYTHSCTKLPIGTCNNCFACEERSWGFQELAKLDPGTLIPDVSDITYKNTWQYSPK